MNFNDLYKTIRAIDENAQPVAPVHTDAPAEEEGIEIIGGPMGLPGMMGHQEPPKQQDNVTMNVSLNGSGSGGVRSLMNILKDIEDGGDSDSAHALFGEPHDGDAEEPIMGDMVKAMSHDQGEEECYTGMEEEMGDDGETWANSAHGDMGHHTHGIDAVTFSGDDMNSKGKISPLARAPGTNAMRHPMHESLVDKLTAMYETIKENAHHDDEEKKIRHLMRKYGWSRQEALEYYHYEEHDPKDYEDMEEGAFKDKDTDRKEKAYAAKQTLKHIKNPTKGEKEAAKDIKPGSYKDRADLLKSAEADGRLDELAKWRDPKYKDKLYTQEPRDPDDYYQSDDDYYNPKPDDYPGAKHKIGGSEYDHNDPLRTGYGRLGVGSLNTHGKRKGMPSRDHITSLKGSIKDAHGKHPKPNLPEQVNESAELNAMLALNKRLNG
jgi:hypothetical protein